MPVRYSSCPGAARVSALAAVSIAYSWSETIKPSALELKGWDTSACFLGSERVAQRLEKERAAIEKRLESLGVSADREARILDAVRMIREKLNTLTDEGQREIVELLEASVVLYRKDNKPWCHIEVSLTEQETDLPIASPQAWVVHPLVSSFGWKNSTTRLPR
jgi:hypothetical protein